MSAGPPLGGYGEVVDMQDAVLIVRQRSWPDGPARWRILRLEIDVSRALAGSDRGRPHWISFDPIELPKEIRFAFEGRTFDDRDFRFDDIDGRLAESLPILIEEIRDLGVVDDRELKLLQFIYEALSPSRHDR